MDRYLTEKLLAHFQSQRQMAFLSGPSQVGKTTIAKRLCRQLDESDSFLNWDNHGNVRDGLDKG